MMTDRGSCVDIFSRITVEKMGLKAKPHQHLYNITWVNKNAQPTIQCYLVPIKMFSYQNHLWCDVLILTLYIFCSVGHGYMIWT